MFSISFNYLWNKFFIILFLLIFIIPFQVNPQTPGNYKKFNINNISTYIYNNGMSDRDTNWNSGLSFPKGSVQYISFASGFVWGGKINGEVRVGGTVYKTGLQPGIILGTGIPDNPELDIYRTFRVRPDYKTSDLLSEINDGEGAKEEIYFQYEKDWQEWPADNGAPYTDLNRNGIYNPETDIPGFPDASQTLWYVANDFDSNLTKNLYGSLPIGLEVQVTVWGYSGIELINNIIFRKYKLINKSGGDIEEMYISIWSDFEIGNAHTDFSGCDTLLNLGYQYNREASDEYLVTIPPAIGNCLLQGPFIPGNPEDEVFFDGQKISGYKNLPMVSTHYLYPYESPLDPPFDEPLEGDYIKGTVHYYNFMQGKIGDGSFHPIPGEFGGGTTRFPLSGDPVTEEGFIDGVQQTFGDRSVGIGTGPFHLAAGDTQEIVFAEIAALGNSNINSIEILKEYAEKVHKFFKENIITSAYDEKQLVPTQYELSQNYPNPFNSTTTISYSVSRHEVIKIKIYDILGNEITTLVNEVKSPGIYSINFNADNLPSGVYFYNLITSGYSETKKLILLK